MKIERICKILALHPREVHGSAVGTSDDVAILVKIGVLKPSGTVRSIVCNRCDEQHLADVITTEEGPGWYCPASGFIPALPDEIAAYTVALDHFLDCLANHADRKRRWAKPSGAPVLWSLGSYQFDGDLRVALYFALDAADPKTLNSVLEVLKTVERPDALAVLTNDMRDLSQIVLPYTGRVVSLIDCAEISGNDSDSSLDLDWLARRVLSADKLKPAKRGRPPVQRVEAFKVLEQLRAKGKLPTGRNAQVDAVEAGLLEEGIGIPTRTIADAVDAWRRK